MWNMGTDPHYIPAKFGDDTLRPEKVIHEKEMYRFLTFNLITGALFQISHDFKSMVIGRNLNNLYTKYTKIP